ncbi:hypothetical protein WKI68_26425 [Streptomyces sp. MS1.HAVA.3]|uniref:Uncharacterized protein n=1 Tax=Streptomyces caledonius TaxID=3134107 RepID=A0ABU8U7T7_9ACTN
MRAEETRGTGGEERAEAVPEDHRGQRHTAEHLVRHGVQDLVEPAAGGLAEPALPPGQRQSEHFHVLRQRFDQGEQGVGAGPGVREHQQARAGRDGRTLEPERRPPGDGGGGTRPDHQ